jgi:hypothetical protein
VSVPVTSPAAVGSVPADPVRALQHTLYRAAKADPGRRFHALWDKVYRRDVLWRAWVSVFRNGGAPGIDKTTLADVQEYGVTRLLDGSYSAGLSAGGSQGPVVKSWRRASSLSSPHLVAVSR